jgi:hypothetical protein
MLAEVTVKSSDLDVLPMQQKTRDENNNQQSDYGEFFQGWCLGFIK